jgi:outer membrane protein TolC
MRLHLGALLVLSFSATPTMAEEVVWSSAAYVQAVLRASDSVDSARESLLISEANLKSQTARTYFPTLGFSATINPAELAPANRFEFDSWRGAANDVVLSPSLSWNLFNGFKDALGLRRTRIDRERTRLDLEISLQAEALAALRNYYGLILRLKLLEVEVKNKEAQDKQYQLTQDRYKHGMKSLSDLLKTETDLRAAELTVESADAQRRLRLFNFNTLLNREEDSPAKFPKSLKLETTAIPDLKEGVRTALLQRPEMRKSRLTLKRADTTWRLAQLNAAPSASLDFSYSDGYASPYGLQRVPFGLGSATYGLTLSLSLPSSFNVYSQAQSLIAARASWRITRNTAEDLDETIRREVYQAHIGLVRSMRSHEIALRAQSISKQNLDLVREQYSQGSADVIRLSQALVDHVRAQSRLMQAYHDANINLAEYRRAIGEPIWH